MASKKKMASKKAAKNLGQTVAFNKKNTEALADMIYSDKGGVVTLLKLCNGDLSNGKDGGRTTHCAVGEAYFQFVNKDMRKILKTKGEKNGYGGHDEYESKYGSSEGPTGAVVDALVEAAVLKNPTDANKRKLAAALDNAVSENDDVEDDSYCMVNSYAERSERVAKVFRKEVAPLLK